MDSLSKVIGVIMRLGVFGLGNMGSAMLKGAVERGVFSSENVFTYDPISSSGHGLPGERLANAEDVARQTDVWLLAMKPDGVVPLLQQLLVERTYKPSIVLSVAAGLSLDSLDVTPRPGGYAASIGLDVASPLYVRCMPNLAASKGAGLSAWMASKAPDVDQRNVIEALLGATGGALELTNEEWFHAFTGATGSGIAYLFLAAEAIADGAVAEGLPRPLARQAAAAAVYGAGVLLQAGDVSPAEWKDRVCSPGGTTIEGIATLEKYGARHAFVSAVRWAAQRSRALARKS